MKDQTRLIRKVGGIVVCEDPDLYREECGCEKQEKVEWVTPITTFNDRETSYWGVCLVVRIGKAGERLAYPTVT